MLKVYPSEVKVAKVMQKLSESDVGLCQLKFKILRRENRHFALLFFYPNSMLNYSMLKHWGRSLKMGSNLLFTCILLPFLGTISLFFIQETRRALDVALGFSLLTFLSSIFL